MTSENVREHMSKIKAVLVTRHELLEAQREAIEKAGIEIVEKVPQIPNEPTEVIKWAKEKISQGITAVVTVALPPHLIQALNQAGMEVIVMKMNTIATVPREQAEKLVAEAPHKRTALPGRTENEPWRVVEFIGLFKVKVKVEEEPIIIV